MVTAERQLNQTAYRRLEKQIEETYPHGQFVAIAGGEIVGDASDFMTLYNALKAGGRDPREVLIVQAGHEYPENVVILSPRVVR